FAKRCLGAHGPRAGATGGRLLLSRPSAQLIAHQLPANAPKPRALCRISCAETFVIAATGKCGQSTCVYPASRGGGVVLYSPRGNDPSVTSQRDRGRTSLR